MLLAASGVHSHYVAGLCCSSEESCVQVDSWSILLACGLLSALGDAVGEPRELLESGRLLGCNGMLSERSSLSGGTWNDLDRLQGF